MLRSLCTPLPLALFPSGPERYKAKKERFGKAAHRAGVGELRCLGPLLVSLWQALRVSLVFSV